MAVIIGKMNSEVEYTRKRMIHIAKEHAKRATCRHCGGKELKAAVLHEFGDPFIPSSIHLYCPKCHKNTPFMVRDIADAKRFAEHVMQKAGEESKKEEAELMIDEMIRQGKAQIKREKEAKEEEKKVIKDEAGEIIANPDQVAKREKTVKSKKKGK